MFDAKEEIEAYVRTLPIKSAFFSPSSFMQNFNTHTSPRPIGDGTYAITNLCHPTTELALIEPAADTGKWVGAMLAEPDKYAGQTFAAATRLYTWEEVVQTMSKVSGKTVLYKQVPDDVFKGFMPPALADTSVQMWQYVRDFGYYGAGQKEMVDWSAKQARGQLTTLEEYLTKHPLNLQ